MEVLEQNQKPILELTEESRGFLEDLRWWVAPFTTNWAINRQKLLRGQSPDLGIGPDFLATTASLLGDICVNAILINEIAGGHPELAVGLRAVNLAQLSPSVRGYVRDQLKDFSGKVKNASDQAIDFFLD